MPCMQMGHTLLCALGLAGIALAPPVRADGTLGGSLVLTSDYVYRGLSQTCGKPAAQADLHYRSGGDRAGPEWFIGGWGSAGLSSGSCAGTDELNLYLGGSFLVTGNSTATLTYTHFSFPDNSSIYPEPITTRYDYDEIEGSWAYHDLLYVTVAWSPNTLRYTNHIFERDRSALSVGLQAHWPLGRAFTLSGGAGYDEFADPYGAGFAFWSAGVGYTLASFQFDVSYFGTAHRAEWLYGPHAAGNRVAGSIVWRF